MLCWVWPGTFGTLVVKDGVYPFPDPASQEWFWRLRFANMFSKCSKVNYFTFICRAKNVKEVTWYLNGDIEISQAIQMQKRLL